MDLCALYARKTGQQPAQMYSGNIGQMLEQVKAGSGATIVISDKVSLKASDVRFARFQPLGEAVLVLAWRKGLSLHSPQDLRGAQVTQNRPSGRQGRHLRPGRRGFSQRQRTHAHGQGQSGHVLHRATGLLLSGFG